MKLTHRKGFTLIELLVVVSIIAILSAVGLATFNTAQMKARDARRKADVEALANAQETFYLATIAEGGGNGTYSLADAGSLDAFLTNTAVPKDPRNSLDYLWPTRTATAFRVCADLEDDGLTWPEAGAARYDFCQTNRQ